MKIKLIAGLSVFALISTALTACGGSKSKDNPEEFYEKPTEGERAFTSVTEFDEDVEFHTEDQ